MNRDKSNKQRLDQVLMKKYPELTRSQAQESIFKGFVFVDKKLCMKPGALVENTQEIILSQLPQYVSKAGVKLEKALEFFALNVEGLVALDAGISTGGFTDCLLQRGVSRVYGVDVGEGLLHEKIRQDPRVVLYENQNLRFLKELPELVDLVTLDLSFISLTKILPIIPAFMKKNGILITLVKPQFEALREEINRQGIVANPLVHERIINQILLQAQSLGFVYHGHCATDIPDIKSKNKEFLCYFRRSDQD